MILLVRSRFVLCIVTAFKGNFWVTLARGIRIDMLSKSPAAFRRRLREIRRWRDMAFVSQSMPASRDKRVPPIKVFGRGVPKGLYYQNYV